MTTVYVTKYALTEGLFKVEASINDSGTLASYTVDGYSQCAYGKDFHLNLEDALKDCEERRVRKLKSIEKQRAKLESLRFKIKD